MNINTDEDVNLQEVKVNGQPYSSLPNDLYIPPDALRILLETFEGPLDLLLYLIKKQNFDILDIPIAEITRQYMQYIDFMQDMQLELAAEYLVMAAMLAEIKSRLLLPRTPIEEEDEKDPRAELIRRLQEYERYQEAAQKLEALPQVDRDIYLADITMPKIEMQPVAPNITITDIFKAFQAVLKRANLYASHQVLPEVLSIRERMTCILANIGNEEFTEFAQLFDIKEGKLGVVVTLIAILELVRGATIECIQTRAFGPIYVRSKESGR